MSLITELTIWTLTALFDLLAPCDGSCGGSGG